MAVRGGVASPEALVDHAAKNTSIVIGTSRHLH